MVQYGGTNASYAFFIFFVIDRKTSLPNRSQVGLESSRSRNGVGRQSMHPMLPENGVLLGTWQIGENRFADGRAMHWISPPNPGRHSHAAAGLHPIQVQNLAGIDRAQLYCLLDLI